MSLGQNPFSATDPEYLVTVPLFDEVKWKTNTGKILTITKPGKGRALTAIKVNDKEIKCYFVPNNLFHNGGKIEVMTK